MFFNNHRSFLNEISDCDLRNIVVFCLVLFLYFYVGYTSYGFDDEYVNIDWVERYGLHVWRIAQTEDVHPPLSYVFNYLLYHVLGDWSAVRAFNGIILVLVAARLSNFLSGRHLFICAFILLCVNPSILMWGTSLRWYSYFLVVVMWALIIPKHLIWRWLKFVICGVLLFHTSYAAFLVLPSLFYIYLAYYRDYSRWALYFAFCSGGLLTLLCLPQIEVLFSVHLANSDGQAGSFLRSLLGIGISFFSNHGLFPLSAFAIVSALSMFGIYFIIAAYTVRESSVVMKNVGIISFGGFLLLAVLSGLGAKFRNLVVGVPFQIICITNFWDRLAENKWSRVLLVGFLFGNLGGVWNVISHADTIKNNWNLPVSQIVTAIEERGEGCSGSTVIAVHDPTLTRVLDGVWPNVVSPYIPNPSEAPLASTINCLFVVKTFHGSIPVNNYKNMIRDLEGLCAQNVEVVYSKVDKYASVKKLLIPSFPTFVVEVQLFTGLNCQVNLPNWTSK